MEVNLCMHHEGETASLLGQQHRIHPKIERPRTRCARDLLDRFPSTADCRRVKLRKDLPSCSRYSPWCNNRRSQCYSRSTWNSVCRRRSSSTVDRGRRFEWDRISSCRCQRNKWSEYTTRNRTGLFLEGRDRFRTGARWDIDFAAVERGSYRCWPGCE